MSSPKEQLHLLLDAGHELSYQELRRKLGLESERHVRRLIRALQREGVPIQERRDGLTKRFFLLPQHQRTKVGELVFDQEELHALAVAAKASQAALGGTPHGAPLARAFGKLLQRVAPAAYLFEVEETEQLWQFDEAPPLGVSREILLALEQACAEHRSVRIDYFTASRRDWSYGRKIDPLMLARRGRSWLVVAWCHERKAIRDFAIAGISSVVPCDPDSVDSYFEEPEGFDREMYFRDRFCAVSGDDYYIVKLIAEADRAPYFRRRNYLPTQQIEEMPDGRIVVSFEVEGLEEIRSFLQSWGSGITVLEPKELVDRMREEAEVLAERYRSVREDVEVGS